MRCLETTPLPIGLWLSLANGYSAEILASSALDWMLIDAEHAPNSIETVLSQLQATKGSRPDIVVRAPCDVPWVLKQYLDIGVHSLMVPMIDTPEQAAELVRSVRYPPSGRRGVATSTSRASRFGREHDYLATADGNLFVMAQIETPLAVSNVRDIASTKGIDAIFIGPADLSANMGHLGDVADPDVQRAIAHCLSEAIELSVPAGIMAATVADANRYAEMGARFVAIGSDIGLLSKGADSLVQTARTEIASSVRSAG